MKNIFIMTDTASIYRSILLKIGTLAATYLQQLDAYLQLILLVPRKEKQANRRNIPFFFALFFFMNGLACQNSIDSLWVAAENGLTIRAKPDLRSERLGSLKFNTLVGLVKYDIVDTIDNRIAHWYRLPDQPGGFVFGGYLNKYPLPDSTYGLLNDYIPIFVKQFGEFTRRYYSDLPNYPGKYYETTEVLQNKSVLIISRSGYEYSQVEYYIEGVDINEFRNLFNLMRFYYGDRSQEMKPYFDEYKLRSFSYGVPDAGMAEYDSNIVRQLDNGVVLIKFTWAL